MAVGGEVRWLLVVNMEGWRRAVGGRAPTTSARSREIINSSAHLSLRNQKTTRRWLFV